LQENVEKNAWDGEWYRRAYFDDGTPLGSAASEECQIDSISQSWSVLSRIGSPERVRRAMCSLDNRLVRRQDAIVKLLDPPFDKSKLDPGYIKGYVPGVRENGGQYTHAAIWAAMAFAELGDSQKAWDLFSLINPIHHGQSPESVATYKVEPYVVAADVYSVPPLTGRGGWTWYTGSAGWMYRLIMESLLGIRLEADRLHFAPCLPADWQSYEIEYMYRETCYRIRIVRPEADSAGPSLVLDGSPQLESVIHLVNDGREHRAELILGRTDNS
jgi:cellobiose phosphorylase